MNELYNMVDDEFENYCMNMSIWDKKLITAKRVFELNVIDRGWKFGEGYSYSKAKVKVPLLCEKGHNVTMSPDSFKAGMGCGTCAGRTSNGDYFIGTEHTTLAGNTITVVGLNRITVGKVRVYDLECSVCSKDEELFPKGSITSSKGNLLSGRIPCGCSKNYQWDKRQYTLKIARYCAENNLTFNGYVGGWRGNVTGVSFTCKNNHVWDTCKIHKVLGKEPAYCKYCIQEERNWGYYENRVLDTDYLYIVRFTSESESFIKIGRSFNVEKRIGGLLRSGYDVQLMLKFKGSHMDVYKQEQLLHKTLRKAGFCVTPLVSFAGDSECFKIEALLEYIDIKLDEV